MGIGLLKKLKQLDKRIRKSSKKVGDKMMKNIGKLIKGGAEFVEDIIKSPIIAPAINIASKVPLLGNVIQNVGQKLNQSSKKFGQHLIDVGNNKTTFIDAMKDFGKDIVHDYPSSFGISQGRLINTIKDGAKMAQSTGDPRQAVKPMIHELRTQFKDFMNYIL